MHSMKALTKPFSNTTKSNPEPSFSLLLLYCATNDSTKVNTPCGKPIKQLTNTDNSHAKTETCNLPTAV